MKQHHPPLHRQRCWRSDLLAWAEEVRGQPYVWGETDCGALVCRALHLQFGVDLFSYLPAWSSARTALRAWATLLGEEGYAALLFKMGAVEVRGRTRGCWPMGTVLISKEEVRRKLPALGIYVTPIVVQSDQEHGVQWSVPTTATVESAWLFEQVVLSYG